MQKYTEEKAVHITEKALHNIVEDVCTFIFKHVIPCEGKYHGHDSELSKPEFRMLTETSRLNLTRTGY